MENEEEIGQQTREGEPLTEREDEVLALTAEDYTHAEIAERFVVSRETVRAHVAHIRKKLHVHSSREAARAYRAKITPLG